MNRRFRRPLVIAAAAVCSTALVGCATEPKSTPSDSASTAASSSATTSAAPEQSSSPATSAAATSDPAAQSSAADASVTPTQADAPFVADTKPDTSAASADAALVLTAIRSGVQSGFDRVVLEFSGPGTPGWQAQYAAKASRQGSGEPISPGGTTNLTVLVSGSTIPSAGAATVAAGQIPTSGTSIKGVFNDGTFEGITQVVLGIATTKPFRVFFVANPPRVVIDVQQ